MKKKLVAGLVIASMISGVSSVYADYTDQDIDAKVTELKQADDAIRGQIGDINGKYNRLEQAQGDLKTKLDNLSAGTQDINGRVDKIEEKQKADDKRIGDLEAEDGEIKKEIGKISDDLNAEKTARGEQEKTLNENMDSSLFDETFIVFEIDSIKDDPLLFPLVTLIIMDVFLQKMRIKKGRKVLVIEEAWKAIASASLRREEMAIGTLPILLTSTKASGRFASSL